MNASKPRFCGQCGGPLTDRFVDAEQRMRLVCTRCGTIAYSNPHVLVNTIVASGDRVLLCRRANPPSAGRWALPGGFMESDETLEEAAVRETLEETGVRLDPTALRLHAVVSLSEISEIYVGFFATIGEHPDLIRGSECSDVRFFSEAEMPWTQFSYPDIGVYLRIYFAERRNDAHAFHFSRLDAASVVDRAYRIAGVEEARWQRPAPTTD
jgi:ADP-ribose pyrophosphatase YjhB (NUDIX family)